MDGSSRAEAVQPGVMAPGRMSVITHLYGERVAGVLRTGDTWRVILDGRIGDDTYRSRTEAVRALARRVLPAADFAPDSATHLLMAAASAVGALETIYRAGGIAEVHTAQAVKAIHRYEDAVLALYPTRGEAAL